MKSITHKTQFGRQSKLQTLCSELLALAQQLGPGQKLPTMLQLRDLYGASLATLNSALTELEAKNVICRKHGVGLYVSPYLYRKSVCLISNPSEFQRPGASPFWEMLTGKILRIMATSDRDFSFHYALPCGPEEFPLPERLVKEIEDGQIDGMLAISLEKKGIEWLESQNIPVVVYAGDGPYTVASDKQDMIRQGVESLAHQDCRRIGLWEPSNPSDSISVAQLTKMDVLERPVGSHCRFFQQALAASNLDFDPALVRDEHYLLNQYLCGAEAGEPRETYQEQGHRLALEIFGKPKDTWPAGIVITNDMMTHGALIALQKLGVRVGQDVKISTHANRGSIILFGRDEDLILIETDPAEIAEKMCVMLNELMSGETPATPQTLLRYKIRK